MRKLAIAGIGMLLAALLAWAGDPWKDKPFTQWTEKDINQVFSASPWSKANVSAQGAWHPLDSSAMTGPVPGQIAGSGTDTSKRSDNPLPDQQGGARRQLNNGPLNFNIFWYSSRTIREAMARKAMLKGTESAEDAQKFVAQPEDEYQLFVQGQNMFTFQQRGEKAFEKAAWLQMKKTKDKVYPSKVEFARGADGESVTGAFFHFPRKDAKGEPTIATDEKEIDFYMKVGDSTLRTYFEPKKMVDAQGQDL